jgi:hypothetical protein
MLLSGTFNVVDDEALTKRAYTDALAHAAGRAVWLSGGEAKVGRVTTETVSAESPDRLRADMVARLKERGVLRSPEVAEAFAKVPREKFAPEASSPAAAYSVWDVVVTKRDAAGKATSSAPTVMAAAAANSPSDSSSTYRPGIAIDARAPARSSPSTLPTPQCRPRP